MQRAAASELVPFDPSLGCVHCGAYANATVGQYGMLVCDRCITLEHVSAGAITPRQELAPPPSRPGP